MSKLHQYHTRTSWTGAGETGTTGYKDYSRDYTLSMEGRPPILASSDPAFLGDPTRHNPEDLLVASASACHMLWYLHYCAVGGVVVKSYLDDAEGVMDEGGPGRGGRFTKITLRPRITITAESDIAKAEALHEKAHAACFIANSLNCPVEIEPTIEWD
ncbi:OsmC family protein [Kordiimonas marina]|uniref:OsmC family protein n=1 Tax=Kordiimonas marina TaxID=2872312 RepID=UPI001FF18F3A|nr:OsmC family protein [Kordiimonas marina]MCJ9429542.1 OsmC family protein [Kordiimonas marina]